MGTLPIKAYRKKSIDNIDFNLEIFTTTSDISDEENGSFSLRVYNEEKNLNYGLEIPVSHYNDKYGNAWLKAVLNNPKWREQFSRGNHNQHKTKKLKVMNGDIVDIDLNIYEAIKKLNELGCITKYCCEGGSNSISYILTENGFPEELSDWFRKLGYHFTSNIVQAHCPWHLSKQQSIKFQLLLNDWTNNNLSKDTSKYQVEEKYKEYNFPKLPSKTIKEKQEATNKMSMFIDRLNKKGNEKIKFKEIMLLKSGRDQYSSLKYDKLIENIDKNIVNSINNEFQDDIKNQEKVLKWYHRGLSQNLSIRKVKTDIEVGENYRNKGKEKSC